MRGWDTHQTDGATKKQQQLNYGVATRLLIGACSSLAGDDQNQMIWRSIEEARRDSAGNKLACLGRAPIYIVFQTK
jgi:hypothetical protein